MMINFAASDSRFSTRLSTIAKSYILTDLKYSLKSCIRNFYDETLRTLIRFAITRF